MTTCERGEFYESVQQPGEDRGHVKRRALIDFFYGKPSYQSPVKDRIEEKYPTFARVMSDLKKRDHRRPSWIMQSRESAMFIGRIARRVMHERPDTPLITLHDSLCSTEPHLDYLEDVARDEFRQIGVVPTFKQEQWN